ncbi:MarR family transcriptional regulator [Streptomyces anthocyanicus]
MTDDPHAPVPTALNPVPLGGGPTNVDLHLKPEKFGNVFLSDRFDPSRTQVPAAAQRPATAASGNEPTQSVAWKTIPSWFLVATDDRTMGTDNLRFMAKRAKATTVEVDAPHAVMETNPEDVTKLILRAAGDSRPSLAKTGTSGRTAFLGGAVVLSIAAGRHRDPRPPHLTDRSATVAQSLHGSIPTDSAVLVPGGGGRAARSGHRTLFQVKRYRVTWRRYDAVMAVHASSRDAASRASDRPGDVSPFALGLLLRRAHWRAAGVMSEALRPLGIELRHFAVLIVLVDRGPTVQRDLAAETGTDKAGIMRVVDDLERRNLAVRKPVPGDRRARAVEITPAGLELFDAAHVAAEPLAEGLVADLGPDDTERLTRLLTRLAHPGGSDA